jgi:hypothetical protein
MSLSIPLILQCEVSFRRVLDYNGTDTRLIEITLPPEIQGAGKLRLPREIFSNQFNENLYLVEGDKP